MYTLESFADSSEVAGFYLEGNGEIQCLTCIYLCHYWAQCPKDQSLSAIITKK